MRKYKVIVYYYDNKGNYEAELLTYNLVSKKEAEKIKEDIIRNPYDRMCSIEKVEISECKNKSNMILMLVSIVIGLAFMACILYSKYVCEDTEAKNKVAKYKLDNTYEMIFEDGKTYNCEFISLYHTIEFCKQDSNRPIYIITIKYDGEYKSVKLYTSSFFNTDFTTESLIDLYEMESGKIYNITKNGDKLTIEDVTN